MQKARIWSWTNVAAHWISACRYPNPSWSVRERQNLHLLTGMRFRHQNDFRSRPWALIVCLIESTDKFQVVQKNLKEKYFFIMTKNHFAIFIFWRKKSGKFLQKIEILIFSIFDFFEKFFPDFRFLRKFSVFFSKNIFSKNIFCHVKKITRIFFAQSGIYLYFRFNTLPAPTDGSGSRSGAENTYQ